MNNKESNVYKLTVGGLLIAIGIILPRLFHMFGTPNLGRMFLPMHLSVFIAGIYLGSLYGLVIGFITPLINSLFGMPVFPQNIIMAFELAAYGFFAGLMIYLLKNQKTARPVKVYISLITSMIAGRIVNALVLLVMAKFLGMSVPAPMSVISATVFGIPGIIIQLILVPAIVFVLSSLKEKHNR